MACLHAGTQGLKLGPSNGNQEVGNVPHALSANNLSTIVWAPRRSSFVVAGDIVVMRCRTACLLKVVDETDNGCRTKASTDDDVWK
jgi:hypothetical protein